MADIAIKMGVNAPGSDVDEVLKVLDYIYQQDPSDDDKPFRFGAYEENFSDGAIGVMASMERRRHIQSTYFKALPEQ